MTPIRDYHPSWKIAVAIVTPLLLLIGVLGWLIAPTKEEAYLNTAFVVTFCAIGWAAGMILSPDSSIEERKFTGRWKGISLFISGYLLSKIDPLVEALLKPEVVLRMHDSIYAYRALAGISATILTAILTYVVRVYAFTVGD
jgi:hypothetical protein